MIDISKVGALPEHVGSGWQVRFSIPLPGITPAKGYQVKVRVIHEGDQFIRAIQPLDVDMTYGGGDYDHWQATLAIAAGPGHFGQDGRYLYRYQLLRNGAVLAQWFADPFGRRAGVGGLSAFVIGAGAGFSWTDAGFVVPEVDDMVVYELHVGEFNSSFDGVVAQTDYLQSLGVNVIELMPVTDVKEQSEWGYTPLGYFAPDERYGGLDGFKRMIDACHAAGIAVIVDAVYAHAHPDFAYNLVYQMSGEPNPMMGVFAGEFFSDPGTDYSKQFTRDYFLLCNQYWLGELHVDGFRYDYVPGMYDGPVGVGYANLVYQTYHTSLPISRFQTPDGRSRIIQCAEHLPDPKGILKDTYSNTAWQNWFLDKARDMAHWRYVDDRFAHVLDPEFLGHVDTRFSEGHAIPVVPFQYIESHDHGRFINEFGLSPVKDLLGQPLGNRDLFYKTQPYAIALMTGKGIPMLWQGQEFAENWGVPPWGIGRNLFARPMHWEYFYDPLGRALIRLYRNLGQLRRTHPALGSRSGFYYFYDPDHLSRGIIAFRREQRLADGSVGQQLIVVVNFADLPATVRVPFPLAGTWHDLLDADSPHPQTLDVPSDGSGIAVTVNSNYGAVFGKV